MIAAAPARHHQNSVSVRQIEKIVGHQLAFQPHRIQVHAANVTEIVFPSRGILVKKHVRRPAAAANQHVFSIYAELSAALWSKPRRDLIDAELKSNAVRSFLSDIKFKL